MTFRPPRRSGAFLPALVASVLIISAACGEQNAGLDTGDAGGAEPAGVVDPLGDAPPPPEPATPASLMTWLEERARELSDAPYRPADTSLPAALAELDYDTYRQIRYRPEEALWRGETPFEVQLFHRAFIQRDRVEIHVVEDGAVRRLPFDPSLFRYDDDAAAVAEVADGGVGWAGFRVHYPVNRPDVADEVAVFLGASYFRLLGPGHVHGLSTRGLAIDVARGEEFPDFRAFWLIRPAPGADTLTVLALLDSPSITGAYRFNLTPGRSGDRAEEGTGGGEETRPTSVVVDARLFARDGVEKLGVAPLTSMFLHGPEVPPPHDDFRPRVHDSQGLLLRTASDEWVWRPLGHGAAVRLSSWPSPEAAGFGLVQRERDFEDYLDLEARYHQRPSEWVEPLGSWGPGSVELVEIPTDSEFHDNIVASWVPDTPLGPGDERRYRYRLHVFDDVLAAGDGPQARVARWREGRDALPGEADGGMGRRFVVDFHTGRAPGTGAPRPDAVLETSAGQVSDLQVLALPEEPGGWRASFRLLPGEADPVDLRLYLHRKGTVVSEIWNHRWSPRP